ncbi:hypothetical protein L207DRAFT_628951 [Hyaloscypha variabilis F]|uniref:Mid2 domain-containing protein n=1 Tax=Hyaloscypha variabilis (strain UAMH 11265 / GT02V1 / F) TaxID=1149755 RepID=A0A2J6S6K7_HYAVF|nr:hypothetical protein L207DRAFT_628951 [Hyaloscypha variabilis F]
MYHFVTVITTILILSARQIEAQLLLATDCYYKLDSAIAHNPPSNPCGVVSPSTNFFACCVPGDACLDGGICHYTPKPTSAPTVVSGYYMGGCTDPTWSSPACAPQCSDLNVPDVVYNDTTQTWHCCGQTNGSIRCDIPTAETFAAPAPSALLATFVVGSAPSTLAASPSSTSLTTTTPSSSSSTSQTSSIVANGGGLSEGAKAGIGIGCGIIGLAGFSALTWFFTHRKNTHEVEKQASEAPFMGYRQKAELPTDNPWRGTENKRGTIRAELV